MSFDNPFEFEGGGNKLDKHGNCFVKAKLCYLRICNGDVYIVSSADIWAIYLDFFWNLFMQLVVYGCFFGTGKFFIFVSY